MLKSLQKSIQQNIGEIYVGLLLFVGLPAIGWLFFDWRAFVALTVIIQSGFGVMYLRKGGK